MAIPRIDTFYVGLTLIALGTGLLKPNDQHDGWQALFRRMMSARCRVLHLLYGD